MKKYTFTEKKDTRSGFGAGMAELGKTNPNVVALCADLVASLKLDAFIKDNPQRFIQCGIAEANMIGVREHAGHSAASFNFCFENGIIVTVAIEVESGALSGTAGSIDDEDDIVEEIALVLKSGVSFDRQARVIARAGLHPYGIVLRNEDICDERWRQRSQGKAAPLGTCFSGIHRAQLGFCKGIWT